MPVIKPACVRDLKSRVSLADVVSRVVALRKAGGSRMKGLCPFHQEKTPSFNVDVDKGFYKCFGCGKAGDAISFVRETEQLSFAEAVEALGQRFGVPIEYEEGGPTREERSLRQEIFDLHEQAADHYHGAFLASSPTGDFFRNYWTEARRFPAALAEEFKIGAAAADDPGLAARLLKRRFSEDALRQCGLFFIRDGAAITLGTLRPRFRGRLMIPIREPQGRIVAFTARQTALTPEDDPAKDAKYVNSPETPIFIKGQLLFNLDRARSAVGEGRPFVMVEGQLDALRCWQVGLKTAVAPQGTSITDGQLALLRRYQPQVECLFDSDPAGQKAALRLLPLALKAGLEVRFLAVEGSAKVDPDLLFLEHGLAAYEELRRGSLSAMAFACRALLPSADSSPESTSRAAQSLLEIIAAAESEVTRASFIQEATPLLRLLPGALQEDFRRLLVHRDRVQAVRTGASGRTDPSPSPEFPLGPRSVAPRISPELDLLRLCLHFEALGLPLSASVPHDWIDTRSAAGILLNRFLGEFEQGAWPGRDHLDEFLQSDEEKSLVASLLFDAPAIEDPMKVAREGLRQLRARALEPRLRQIELALASPPQDSKADPISLLKERSELHRQLHQPVHLVAAT